MKKRTYSAPSQVSSVPNHWWSWSDYLFTENPCPSRHYPPSTRAPLLAPLVQNIDLGLNQEKTINQQPENGQSISGNWVALAFNVMAVITLFDGFEASVASESLLHSYSNCEPKHLLSILTSHNSFTFLWCINFVGLLPNSCLVVNDYLCHSFAAC
jgi:hypothetical protein